MQSVLSTATYADFPPVHQIDETQPGAVGQSGKEQRPVVALRGITLTQAIYAFTDMSSRENLRLSIYNKEWNFGIEQHSSKGSQGQLWECGSQR